eukprot:11889637-Alexandrium_andersonii.AAC.1
MSASLVGSEMCIRDRGGVLGERQAPAARTGRCDGLPARRNTRPEGRSATMPLSFWHQPRI